MLLCRYLGELKSNVRNKAHPEGCIAESVLAKEAMVLCSGFLDGFQSLVNKLSRTDDNDETLESSIGPASTLFSKCWKGTWKATKLCYKRSGKSTSTKLCVILLF